MKVGVVVTPNQKGQIVIPKKIRDSLGINSNTPLNIIASGSGIFIQPINQVSFKLGQEDSYLKLLEKTKGSWQDEDISFIKKRERIEKKASEDRKKKW